MTPGEASGSGLRAVAGRALNGRARYLVIAAIVVAWLIVGIVVGLTTAGGVVWF